MKKTKITIAGIGAVGGYFGGLLAKQFEESETVETSFIARGEHLNRIRQDGLRIIKGDNEFIARPAMVTDNPADIGVADYIIVATKSYGLEEMMRQLQPCIDRNTIILPLLNGVDSKDRIQSIYPDNMVLDGCVYIVSRLKQAGIIENIGTLESLYFGLDGEVNDRLMLLEQYMKQASVHVHLAQNISTVLWEKFIFISPTATATSYFNNTIGELVGNAEKLNTVKLLIEEVKQIAIAKGIVLPDDISDKSLNKLKGMPFAATSSMHSDYLNNKPQTELESLTGYVVNEGRKFNSPVPTYEMMYKALKEKTAGKMF